MSWGSAKSWSSVSESMASSESLSVSPSGSPSASSTASSSSSSSPSSSTCYCVPGDRLATYEDWWYYIGETYNGWHTGHALTKTVSSPTYYMFTWSGAYGQQAWVELDLAAGRIRCYFYLKRWNENIYLEALSAWTSFSYFNQVAFFTILNEWETLINCNEATVTVSIPCQL